MFLKRVLILTLLSSSSVRCGSGCDELITCGACVGHAVEKCVWCPKTVKKGSNVKQHCKPEAFAVKHGAEWCEVAIENPQSSAEEIRKESLNSGNNTNKIHLVPQYMKLKIRPGVPVSYNVTYQLGKDFPLDVYFLMDFSYTMLTVKKRIRALTQQIHKSLSKISTNVRIGMGSFIDKAAMPFVEAPRHKGTYLFKNNIPLTDDLHYFQETWKILYYQWFSNFDNPEGGLDALMQVIVCGGQIGWRDEARRMVVLFTDDVYHSAGDGRIVGAFKPNDMKCHLENNQLANDVAFDYPSVSQINKVVKDNNVMVIFAVSGTKRVRGAYEKLSNMIEGSTVVDFSSKRLSDIITDSYKDLLLYPLLTFDPQPNIKVELDPPCHRKTKSNLCKAEQFQSKEVQVTITLTTCDVTGPQRVEIGVVGLRDKLSIHVEPLCSCACESERKENDTQCNGSGALECGVCRCYGNKKGESCDCEGDVDDFDDLKCIRPNDTYSCSQRGDCRCGKCDCRQSHGDYCEFTDSDCPWVEERVCGGRGACRRRACECLQGWRGDDCTCPEGSDACLEPYSGQVCSGNGVCNCGKCECTNKDDVTDGFCSVNLADKKCKQLAKYVECVYNNTNNVEEKAKCLEYQHWATEENTIIVNKTEIENNTWPLHAWCSLPRGEHFIVFGHKFIAPQLHIVIQSELGEPAGTANLWIVIGSTVGVILLIGLITTVAAKVMIDRHDAMEYQRFVEDLKNMGMESAELNALYEPAKTEVRNPRYRISFYQH
ncbi:hypothetical protein JYU34_002808 [Plutella xylostella]|uniref:Integrin beta n=1 Tax=Plutella xylostella TaxID=51655 RepID=A0ABQ7R372_PLUXY|nr:hypothetical protein JYU34_002808 [Plutella xylostella]